MKRFSMPVVSLLLFTCAAAIAFIRSDTSQVIIYNDTGTALGPLSVTACGQKMEIPALDDRASIRFRLANSGGESSIELRALNGPAWTWTGEYIEPSGGYLVFVHLRAGLEVETNSQISFLQKMIGGEQN